MGRRGGYGNAGYFAQRMELNTWYDVRKVVAFFALDNRAPSISKAQAKAVIDALLKAKCYKTERHPEQFKVRLLARIELEDEHAKALEDRLFASVPTTKQFYLHFILSQRWNIVPNQKRISLSRRDQRLPVIAGAKDNKSAIKVDDKLYTLVAWNKSLTTQGMYDLVLQEAEPDKLAVLTNDPVCVDLS